MTARRISPRTTLDNLKKEAKHWLKQLRSGDPEARARLERALPKAPADPVLRDIQHALAREHEFAGWTELKQALVSRAGAQGSPEGSHGQLVERFLEYACPDHHVRGRPAHRMARHAAMRLLGRHPEIARTDLYTAVVCGEIEQVRGILREHPVLANTNRPASGPARSGAGGSYDFLRDLGGKDWTPLLFLCLTRLDLPQANDNAVAIARLLLDHGADPNAFFMAGASRYTPLTGVIGEGEEDRPPHPKRDELARLLLERGAEPHDEQVIYNIHFHGNVLWWLKLMYEFSLKAGRKAQWEDPEWTMLRQGRYGSGARWHLWIAVQHNDLELAEWCLQHGATPNAGPPEAARLPQNSLCEQAARLGETEMAALLARYGAIPSPVPADSEDAYVAACFRRDRAAAEALREKHPEVLRSCAALHAAARQDRADVAAFLLDFGVSPNIEDPGQGNQTALHVAAYSGAESVVDLLIRRGAKIDPVDAVHDATPLWFAMWAQHDRIVSRLARYSRDLWALSFTGHLERLREVLRAEPRLATVAGESTPLFWLPEDEKRAVEIVEMFLSLGADAAFRRREDGLAAAEVARRRGLTEAADMLAAAEKQPPRRQSAVPQTPAVEKYERLANDMVKVYAAGDEAALRSVKDHFGRSFTGEDLRSVVWGLLYKVRQASGSAEAFGLAEAKELISRTSGFPNWTALIEAAAAGTAPPGQPHAIDPKTNRISLRRIPSPKDWDTIIGVMKERRIPTLEAAVMTDEAMERIAQLDFVTGLSLGGARGLSDDGMQHVARMPQLEYLNLSEYPGGKLTDRGLEVLRHLPNLRKFEMTWQKGISDAGAANLRFCDKLEEVNLMGSPTGDGAIDALRGKPALRSFSTGRLVTDAGLPLLHDFPMFKKLHGPVPDKIAGPHDVPARLLIDGPFTNKGLEGLAGLEGVVELDLFWHVTGITGDGFACLTGMPNLASLGCDGELSSNEAMRHIADIPRLRILRAQESVATDEGFEVLSRSQTLEGFWGRECPNFGSRGFVAFSKLPRLRSLGVGCQKVDDAALSTLPKFPSLREFTPIAFQDRGFRHIGRCGKLERLTCMYCRETGDEATEHIAGLHLKYYYAGLTKITDRSLEILGRMDSLETVELFETKAVTDAGLAHLAKLPRLNRVELFGLPHVTLAGTMVFPASVQVNYEV